MGKMIGYVEGAEIYLVIALLIFLGVFVFAAIYMFFLSKEHLAELANLPLEATKNQEHEKKY
jgi:hypothetical protein